MGWVGSKNGYYIIKAVGLCRWPAVVGRVKCGRGGWAGYVDRMSIT